MAEMNPGQKADLDQNTLILAAVILTMSTMNNAAVQFSEEMKPFIQKLKAEMENNPEVKKMLEEVCSVASSLSTMTADGAKTLKEMVDKLKSDPEAMAEFNKLLDVMAQKTPELADPAARQKFLAELENILKPAVQATAEVSGECKAPAQAMRGYQEGVNGSAFTAVVPATGNMDFNLHTGGIIGGIFAKASDNMNFALVDAKLPVNLGMGIDMGVPGVKHQAFDGSGMGDDVKAVVFGKSNLAAAAM